MFEKADSVDEVNRLRLYGEVYSREEIRKHILAQLLEYKKANKSRSLTSRFLRRKPTYAIFAPGPGEVVLHVVSPDELKRVHHTAKYLTVWCECRFIPERYNCGDLSLKMPIER